ncbi:MAG: hypothetical protein II943_03585 [Victivallales bacterium]|nr:hypothetical protein [Victivallales bacterium]
MMTYEQFKERVIDETHKYWKTQTRTQIADFIAREEIMLREAYEPMDTPEKLAKLICREHTDNAERRLWAENDGQRMFDAEIHACAYALQLMY